MDRRNSSVWIVARRKTWEIVKRRVSIQHKRKEDGKNMKAAMQYQNKTPEEIVRQYKKKLRAKQGLLILIFLLYVIVGIRGIWWGDDGIADVLLELLILIVITFPINVWISWDFMSLNLILNQNCDPVTYIQVLRLLKKVPESVKLVVL